MDVKRPKQLARGSAFVWFDYAFDEGSNKDEYIITWHAVIRHAVIQGNLIVDKKPENI